MLPLPVEEPESWKNADFCDKGKGHCYCTEKLRGEARSIQMQCIQEEKFREISTIIHCRSKYYFHLMINYLANKFSCKVWQEFKNKQEGKLRN